jgi:hypothetical protein
MRTAFAFLVLIGLSIPASYAQPFRVATWQVPDQHLMKGATNSPTAGPDAVTDIAATLGGLDADAIILYGISDGQVLKKIGDSIKPKKHSIALHMVFRHGGSRGTIVGEPVAILSEKQKMHSKTFDWSDSGRIDIPGGFGFATFKHGASAVALYVAGLPGSLTNMNNPGDRDYVARKRDYAAQYVVSHIGWLATTYTNPVFATYFTGDINTGSKRVLKDECLSILEKSGFRTFLLGAASDKSAVSITNSRAIDRVLDPVFTRSVEFIASRQIARPAPEQPIVICDLTLKAAGVAAFNTPSGRRAASTPKPVSVPAPPPKTVPAVAPAVEAPISLASIATAPAQDQKPSSSTVSPAPAAAAPSPASITTSTPSAAATLPAITPSSTAPSLSLNWPFLQENWFAPVVAAVGAALMAMVFFFAHATRRRHPPLAVTPGPGEAVFVEVGHADANAERPALVTGEPAVVSEVTTSTDNAHNVHHALWRTPRVDFGNQEHADPVRASLLSHLRHLMRDKLFAWLSQQRSHLIDSHETGTKQVLGLEERLERIKVQFQDRLISQEERIAELDQQLQAKDRFIRDAMQPRAREEDRESSNH